MANRIIAYLRDQHGQCVYCEAKRVRERMAVECAAIEAAVGADQFDFWIPSAGVIAGETDRFDDADDEDERPGVRWTFCKRFAPVPYDVPDVAAFLVQELRDYAQRVVEMADKLDGAAGKAVR